MLGNLIDDKSKDDQNDKQEEGKYSEEEIRKAFNTIIFGSQSSEYDTYDSILDIPIDLFIACEKQINNKIESSMTCVEDVINSKRTDYVSAKSNDESGSNDESE